MQRKSCSKGKETETQQRDTDTDQVPPAALAAKKEEISSNELAKQLGLPSEETRVLDEDFKEEKLNYDTAWLKCTHLQNVSIF